MMGGEEGVVVWEGRVGLGVCSMEEEGWEGRVGLGVCSMEEEGWEGVVVGE